MPSASVRRQVSVNLPRFIQVVSPAFYTQTTTVIEELVQNSQRAGATHIDFTFEDDHFIIEDNGYGMPNGFDSLLDICQTGWSSKVQDEESPFGMGFWSVLMLADVVTVNSFDRELVIDAKALRDGDLDAITERQGTINHEGFRVHVTVNQDLSNKAYSAYRFASHTRDLVLWLPFEGVTVDGMDAATGESFVRPRGNEKVGRRVEFEGAEGWVGLTDDYYPSIGLYYHGRRVTSVYRDHLSGIVNFTGKAITLRAPDRKDYVHDEKFSEFSEYLAQTARELALEALRSGDEDLLRDIDGALGSLLDDDDLRGSFKLKVRRGKELDAFIPPDHDREVTPSQAPPKPTPCRPAPTTDHLPSMSDSELEEAPELVEDEPDEEEIVFWTNKVSYSRRDLTLARDLGLPVVIVRSKLERRIARANGYIDLDRLTSFTRLHLTFSEGNVPGVAADGAVILARMALVLGVDIDLAHFTAYYKIGDMLYNCEVGEIVGFDSKVVFDYSIFDSFESLDTHTEKVRFVASVLPRFAQQVARLFLGETLDEDRLPEPAFEAIEKLLINLPEITAPVLRNT